MNFFQALTLPFIRNALMAGILSSVLFGIIGSVVTVRRIAGLAGSISHAVLGGIGIALYLNATGKVPGLPPLAGAVVFALLSAIIIGYVSLKGKQREDTVINAIWAIGMSIGVLFMAKTPGYTDPSSYLFGNVLLISNQDLFWLFILDIVVLFLTLRYYPQIEASSFDEEFTQVRGIQTQRIFLIILGITAVSVVFLQTYVGIVMVIAMLTLPAGTAGYFAKNLATMMIGGTLYAALFSFGGLAVGWILDVPVGAMTVVFAGAVFLGTAGFTLLRKKIARRKKQQGNS
ncbi:MAG: metal ABC transporter permease [Sphaerochaetaceae bacterium]